MNSSRSKHVNGHCIVDIVTKICALEEKYKNVLMRSTPGTQ